jgi:hypothetical protein
MPKKDWTKKDERKYEAILASCKLERPRGKKRTAATCKRIAAATVNRDRKVGLKDRGGRRGLGAITQSDLDKTAQQIRAMREDWMRVGSHEWQWARENVAKAEAAAAQCNPESWYVQNALDYLAMALQSYTAADVYDGLVGGWASSSVGVPAQIRREIVSLGETLALAMSHCKR